MIRIPSLRIPRRCRCPRRPPGSPRDPHGPGRSNRSTRWWTAVRPRPAPADPPARSHRTGDGDTGPAPGKDPTPRDGSPTATAFQVGGAQPRAPSSCRRRRRRAVGSRAPRGGRPFGVLVRLDLLAGGLAGGGAMGRIHVEQTDDDPAQQPNELLTLGGLQVPQDVLVDKELFLLRDRAELGAPIRGGDDARSPVGRIRLAADEAVPLQLVDQADHDRAVDPEPSPITLATKDGRCPICCMSTRAWPVRAQPPGPSAQPSSRPGGPPTPVAPSPTGTWRSPRRRTWTGTPSPRPACRPSSTLPRRPRPSSGARSS
ncbi:hypothetical protein FAIPA1_30017 [Frankia sp. AiPs1]